MSSEQQAGGGDTTPVATEVAGRWSSPTWTTRREALQVVCHRRNLRSTVVIALIVGTVLFAINQLDVVVHGGANATVVLKIALTYVVPFCVSNYGVLVATRRRRSMPPVATRRDRVR